MKILITTVLSALLLGACGFLTDPSAEPEWVAIDAFGCQPRGVLIGDPLAWCHIVAEKNDMFFDPAAQAAGPDSFTVLVPWFRNGPDSMMVIVNIHDSLTGKTFGFRGDLHIPQRNASRADTLPIPPISRVADRTLTADLVLVEWLRNGADVTPILDTTFVWEIEATETDSIKDRSAIALGDLGLRGLNPRTGR